MYYLAALILASGFLYFLLRSIFLKNLAGLENNYAALKEGYAGLFQKNLGFKRENQELKNNFENTLALYDITRQISKSLETDKVFEFFREEINKHIGIKDCRFLGKDQDLCAYKDYSAIPLQINKVVVGYLAAKGLEEKDKTKFQILAKQFLMGVKRSMLYQEIQELAITDSLTGISNRRYYMERFQEELKRSGKFNYIFSCLMIDIDHFKNYNDRYGHMVGDAVLIEAAKRIKENIRQIDFMSRYGGEEFSVILSETDKDLAKTAAERIRKAIEEKAIKVYDEELKVTVSIGISTFPQDGRDCQALIDNADAALYRAKQAGRNKVCVF